MNTQFVLPLYAEGMDAWSMTWHSLCLILYGERMPGIVGFYLLLATLGISILS